MDEQDWQILAFVHDSRFATGPQLVRTLWHSDNRDSAAARAGRRALKRLTEWRVLERLPRRVGGRRFGSDQLIYRVGRGGVRLLETRGIHGPRVELPGLLHLQHTLTVTELVVRLHEAHHAGELELIAAEQEPACWRGYIGAGVARRVIKPDLRLRLGAGALEDHWMLEVDLATESSRTIVRKAARYHEHYTSGSEQSAHGTYPRVLWSTPDADRAEQLRKLLARQPEPMRNLFNVCRIEEAVGFLAREARS